MVLNMHDRNNRLREADKRKYNDLFDQMITNCKKLKSLDTEVPTPRRDSQVSAAEDMIELLNPWKRPKTVQEAHKAIIKDLMDQQQTLELNLLQMNSARHFGWGQPLLFVLLMGLTFGIFCFASLGFIDENLISWGRASFYGVINRIAQSTFQERLILSSIAVWLVGSGLLWSTIRR